MYAKQCLRSLKLKNELYSSYTVKALSCMHMRIICHIVKYLSMEPLVAVGMSTRMKLTQLIKMSTLLHQSNKMIVHWFIWFWWL